MAKNNLELVSDKKNMEGITSSLPSDINGQMFIKSIQTELRKNPKLMSTTPESFRNCIMQIAQVGLIPGSVNGYVYLIPYGNICQLMLGYRGMMALARRSNQILAISTEVVYEGDIFEYEFGTTPYIKHVPSLQKSPSIIASYAIAKYTNGSEQIEIMGKHDIDNIRSFSKDSNGIWKMHYAEMARKSVIRRLFKYLPTDTSIMEIVQASDEAEFNEQSQPASMSKSKTQQIIDILESESESESESETKDEINNND